MMAYRIERVNRSTRPQEPGTGAGRMSDRSDAELLDRFQGVGGPGAEAAFAALVERHGPMVLRTCRALLGEAHAADDAFQATFVVLMRRAGSLRVRGSLGPWLHEVAYRVASSQRAGAARRARHERRAGEMASAESAQPEPADDAAPVLHEELSRLPERYRRPVVLCYLQGLTSEEAARQLGWPVGTERSRLARAREQLRGRLARRGVVFTASLLGASLARETAAAVPPALAGSTVSTVMRAAAGAAAPEGLGPLVEAGLNASHPGRAGALWLAAGAGVAAVGLVAVALSTLPWGGDPLALQAPDVPEKAPTFQRLGGRMPSVWSLAVARDGSRLVSGHNAEIRFWDLPKRELLWKAEVPDRTVRRVDLAQSGPFLAAAQYPEGGKPPEEDVVTIRSTADGRVQQTYHGHDQGVNCVAIAPDGKLAASNDWGDQEVRLWDTATGREVATLAGHTGAVISVAFSADGRWLASTSMDQTVRVWDVAARSVRTVFRGHSKGVEAVAFSPDGSLAASAGYDRAVRVWDTSNGRERHILTTPQAALAVAFSPDGQSVAASCAQWGDGFYGSAPTLLVLWRPEARRRVLSWNAGQSQVFGLSFTPDGATLLSGALDGSIRLWRFGEDRGMGKADR